ncbi:OmpH family outer membrane protein [Actinobacillus delphinicola]|uniref:Uncharacterized protein n=1 Tax=Actinobacillus delphinicola TaxID=51161 RepID=A0A448TUY9_9PAST|nr:OmpH family outer membrane protein [Actinobacillus delphinicola]VEJ09744.1 Uncharacterised protein [Actinobacillus delphinicola]
METLKPNAVTVDDLLNPVDFKNVESLKKAQTRLKIRLTKKSNELKKLQENTEMNIPELNQLIQIAQKEINVIEQALERVKSKLTELNQATSEREVAEVEPETSPNTTETLETSGPNSDPRQLKGKQGPCRYSYLGESSNPTGYLRTYANGETESLPYAEEAHEATYISDNYLYEADGSYKLLGSDTYYDSATNRLWNAEKGWFTVDQLD